MKVRTHNQWRAALIPALVLVLASYAGLGAANAPSTGDQANPIGGTVTASTTITATVQAVDPANRTVTLQTPDGTTRTYQVGPEAINFDQIKVGDQVKATYVESLAISLRNANEPPSAAESQAITRAPKGSMPSGTIVNTTELTARVTAIDTANRTVTLVGPAGNTRTLKVGPDVDLTKVKPGDNVVVRYTEALKIQVERPSEAMAQPETSGVQV
jgi:Cu/Ag efflux protein CusF